MFMGKKICWYGTRVLLLMFNQIQALVPPWGCADVSVITSIGWIWIVPVQMACGSLAWLQSPRLGSLNGYVCPKWQRYDVEVHRMDYRLKSSSILQANCALSEQSHLLSMTQIRHVRGQDPYLPSLSEKSVMDYDRPPLHENRKKCERVN